MTFTHRRALSAAALIAFLAGAVVPGAPASGGAPLGGQRSGAELLDDPELALHFTVNSDPHRSSVAFRITGVLTDPGGSPLEQHTVRVSLDPGPEMLLAAEDDDTGAPVLPLAETLTGASGEFQVHVPALRDISSWVDEDGEVSLLFTGVGPGHLLMWSLYAALPTTPGSMAIAGLVDERNFSSAAVALAANGQEVALDGVTIAAFPTQPLVDAGVQSHTQPCGPGGTMQWRVVGSDYHRWKILRVAYTGPNTRLETSYQTTHSTTMTKAVQVGTNSWVKGSYSKSATNSSTLERNANFGNNVREYHDLSWRWRNFEYGCWFGSEWRHGGHREARPMEATLSTRRINYPLTFSCGGTGASWRPQIPGGDSVRIFTSSSYSTTYGGSFSIQGATLDVRHTGTTTNGHKSVWSNTSSSSTTICGVDNFAHRTLKVRGF